MKSIWTGKRTYFPTVKAVAYEGPATDNPLAFRFYKADQKVAGKTMEEHFRFATAYWHTFCNEGSDPFGPGTRVFPWNDNKDPLEAARDKADAAFEFTSKLGTPFYCFHDVDASPDHDDPAVYEKNFHVVIKWLKERQEATGVKLLWNTSNLFSHPRYRNGAATNPDFRVVTRGAFQVKTSLEASVELGASNYVFWGGREGYSSLWNTNMKREQEHMARFLMMARDYGRSIGFKGVYLIEPKPMEPSKHQYDFDAATVIGFLRAHGLDKDFKLNLEANHATLAGHEFAHDLQVAADAGLLGSIDANRGDPQNGWDTDQFPNDLYETTKAMLVTLGAGGIGHGGFNFDAKVRRSSTDLTDLFEAHIAGMDAFAVGLVTADRIRSQGKLGKFLSERYASFDSGAGADFEKGKLDFKALAALAHSNQNLHLASGKEEWIEALINQALLAK